MSTGETNRLQAGEDLGRESLLCRELYAELEEILRHKWLESEKAGYDIGFDLAMIDWNLRYRSRWLRERRRNHPLFPDLALA